MAAASHESSVTAMESITGSIACVKDNGYYGSVKFDLAKLYALLREHRLVVDPEAIQDHSRDRKDEAEKHRPFIVCN